MSEQGKKKILVVDDEKSTTLSIASHLKNYASDYELYRAFTKDEAIENIKAHEPDVVLLDIELNGVNAGISILDYLNHEHKKIRTIVVSGKAKHLKDQLEEMGCFHFFTKPVDLIELKNKIKDALGIQKITEDRDHAPVAEGKPQAKLLLIEPDLRAFSYLASIFDPSAKDLQNGADYKIKVIVDLAEMLDALMNFQPDVVLIGDFFMDQGQLLNILKLILENIKIKPKVIIVHGLFERDDLFEIKLKNMGVKRCIQNVINQDELLEMNRKLSDVVAEECIKRGLIQ